MHKTPSFILQSPASLVRPGMNWTHECASEMMLEHLVEENAVDLEKTELKFIQELIQGTPRPSVLVLLSLSFRSFHLFLFFFFFFSFKFILLFFAGQTLG